MPDRVVVSGSRTWTNPGPIAGRLARLSRDVVIVHGACPNGVDAMADRAARQLGFTVERYPADWERYGRGAGFRRNDVMLSLPDVVLVLAFRVRSGPSPGTDHVIAGAGRRGLALETFVTDPVRIWYRVQVPPPPPGLRISETGFTCGIETDEAGTVLSAAPVMRWALGLDLDRVANWVLGKGGTIEPLDVVAQ